MAKRNTASFDKLMKLLDLLRDRKSMLIVLQDHPDPDAIACAVALREIAHIIPELACSMTCGGEVGRAENQALVSYLDINLRPTADLKLENFDVIAMVDTQPGTGNNSLPEDAQPDIVIDHHPIRKATRSAEFTDIRRNYGATATILTEYLRAADIEPSPSIATGLLYGIRSDTQDLGRETSRADIDAYIYLYQRANLRMLSQIQHWSLPAEYFRLLHRALDNARIYGECLIADLGRVENADMMGEVADLLLRQREVTWCLCMGALKNTVIVSMRTSKPDVNAGKVIKRIVGSSGTAGGHQLAAGGQIPLKTGSKNELTKVERRLRQKYLKALNPSDASCRPLLRMSDESDA